jgi:hypothetical protein
LNQDSNGDYISSGGGSVSVGNQSFESGDDLQAHPEHTIGCVRCNVVFTRHRMTCTDSKNIDEQERERQLRDQETALVQLGKLYRDQKYVHILLDCIYSDPKSLRNAKGVAEIITLSRSFMSSTAKAKTAKLSA